MIRALLLILAVARATRFFTSDTLGEWVIVGRAKEWAMQYERRARRAEYDEQARWQTQPMPPYSHWGSDRDNEPRTWQAKVVSMADCPFCIGFHLGWLALLGELTIARVPVLGAVWRFGVAAFALNYVVGHVSARLDGHG